MTENNDQLTASSSDEENSSATETVADDTVQVVPKDEQETDSGSTSDMTETVESESVSSGNAMDDSSETSEPDLNSKDDLNKEDKVSDDLAGQWYVLHTYSGYELKVEMAILQAIEVESLHDKVFKVVVPQEDTIEVKDGKRLEKTRKLFPGYAFINMLVDDDVWAIIRRIPGVLKFIGPGNKPEPVADVEMIKVLRRMGIKAKRVEVDFEFGEMIKIISGPFRGYTGSITEINGERGKLKTLISIFGRETPVELTFDQVEKAS